MATIFFIIAATRLRNDLHPNKINSSHILFRSFSFAILSESILRWNVAFLLFPETPHIVQSRVGVMVLGLIEAIKNSNYFVIFLAWFGR